MRGGGWGCLGADLTSRPERDGQIDVYLAHWSNSKHRRKVPESEAWGGGGGGGGGVTNDFINGQYMQR